MRATVIWTGEPLECNDQPEKVPWQGLDSLPASVAEDAAGLYFRVCRASDLVFLRASLQGGRLRGLDPRDVAVVRYGSWAEHPERLQIADALTGLGLVIPTTPEEIAAAVATLSAMAAQLA